MVDYTLILRPTNLSLGDRPTSICERRAPRFRLPARRPRWDKAIQDTWCKVFVPDVGVVKAEIWGYGPALETT